jgi:dienelactone hydrolase
MYAGGQRQEQEQRLKPGKKRRRTGLIFLATLPILLTLILLTLSACSHLASPEVRQQNATQLAAHSGWVPLYLPAAPFVLAAFVPASITPSDTLTVYIEGDGLAWISRTQVSANPTPMNPVALSMALHQPHGAAAYLARPCQYVQGSDAKNCDNSWWTDRRFAPEIITASSTAIDQLMQRFQAQHLVLVGYSGGGAVAALVAAQRHDVSLLVTVAGNLDPHTWARLNKITPLTNSLSPADAWQHLVDVPQLHFAGSRDTTITLPVSQAYIARFPENRRPVLRVIDGFDHHCCWAEKWAELYPLVSDTEKRSIK